MSLDEIRVRVECFGGHRSEGHKAPEDRAKLLAALDAARAVHEPTDALMYSGRHQRVVQVCTGCGMDDGNWQRYPCPTVRAITEALQ